MAEPTALPTVLVLDDEKNIRHAIQIALEQEGMHALQAAGFRPDYFSIRDANTLDEPTESSSDLVVLTAARIGRARLIDNVRATLR